MSQMTITIITVCYNSVSVIRTAMESVLRQTWPEVEYLVIDGGSSDGTVDVIREYEPKFAGKVRWISESDRGMYDAINKGIRMATGEVIGVLNADDVLSDDRVLERVAACYCGHPVAAMESVKQGPGELRTKACGHEEDVLESGVGSGRGPGQGSYRDTDVIYGDIRFVADRRDGYLDALRAEPTVRYYSARHWRPWMLQWGFMPPHPSVYIRRACFEQLGDYALDYKIAADYALLIRFLRKAKLRSGYLPLCMVDMRMGGKSTKNWRSNLQLNQEIVRGNREAGYFCCLAMLLPKYVFKVWEFIGPKLRNMFSRKGAQRA